MRPARRTTIPAVTSSPASIPGRDRRSFGSLSLAMRSIKATSTAIGTLMLDSLAIGGALCMLAPRGGGSASTRFAYRHAK
jgi:hypothetical protein